MNLPSCNFALTLLAAVLTTAATGFSLAKGWYEAAIPSFFCALLFTLGSIRMHRKYLKKVTFMFNAIENEDFNFKFNEQHSSTNDILFNAALNRIKDIMARFKTEMAEREKFFELILEHSGTGVILADSLGRVYLSNRSALRLFGLDRLTHLSQINGFGRDFPEKLLSAPIGSRLQFQASNERGTVDLSITVSHAQAKGKTLRILAISDIRGELDEKEIESWIRLIRVLTHEIMNSITPITSLSDSLTKLAREDDTDLRKGLETISSTGKALISFVDSYREITRIPHPQSAPFPVASLLERIVHLNPSQNTVIALHVHPDTLSGFGDEKLLTQVLMNLVKNSLEAIGDIPGGKIEISARKNAAGKISITVTDNGPGIPPEVLPQIFVPFFTTKNRGSGIGLSISRQIAHRHSGSLRHLPTERGSTFELEF